MIDMRQLIQMARGGADPAQTLMVIAKSNPQVSQVMRMVNGKTPAEMRQIVYAEARQRGVDINQLAGQLGLKLPE